MESQYGCPLVFTQESFFGKVIASALDKTVYQNKDKRFVWKAFDEYKEELKIFLPIQWLKRYYYGTDISPKKSVFVNKLIENKFEEDLYMFCHILDLVGVERKDSLEEFCRLRKIEIDEDITFEAIKKIEYRYRIKVEKGIPSPPSAIITNALQMTFF